MAALLSLFLLACTDISLAQSSPRTFHSVNGMILLDAAVNGKPAVLVLDTGTASTIVSAQLANAIIPLKACLFERASYSKAMLRRKDAPALISQAMMQLSGHARSP